MQILNLIIIIIIIINFLCMSLFSWLGMRFIYPISHYSHCVYGSYDDYGDSRLLLIAFHRIMLSRFDTHL